MDEELRERAALEAEERVEVRRDDDGTLWRKVYFGSGEHFRGWLSQCREIAGEENVRLERVETTGLACFEREGEELYRIWIRSDGSRGTEAQQGDGGAALGAAGTEAQQGEQGDGGAAGTETQQGDGGAAGTEAQQVDGGADDLW